MDGFAKDGISSDTDTHLPCNLLTLSQMGGILDSPLLNRYPLFLKQREARQLETTQHFDKALKCSCFDTIKNFLGTLGKKWGHAK